MPLPIDLVLVRHGESEGNIAKLLSEQGDHTLIKRIRDSSRHTSSFRLTTKGRQQALLAGKALRDSGHGLGHFDRYYTSEYVRAMETAALLYLPGASWFAEPYLTERDWGDLDVLPEDEREAKFGESLMRREKEPFFWRPHNGESFNQLRLRVDRVLFTLQRECSDKRVIVVCHGEVIWAFRVLLERMSQVRFKELHLSKDPMVKVHNCQIFHYTRRDPESQRLSPFMTHFRWIRPTTDPVIQSGWKNIERPRYTNEELLAVVSKEESMVA